MINASLSASDEIKVITDHENVLRGDLVEVGEGLDGLAGFVVESLGLDEDGISLLQPDGAEFGFLPAELMDFGVKIQRQEAEVMAGEVVLSAGIAETNDEAHIFYSGLLYSWVFFRFYHTLGYRKIINLPK